MIGIRGFPGSPEALSRLLSKGFVVPGWTKETMADFYQAPHLPPFITTDAGWDFFQRMNEKAFKGGEIRKAMALPYFLERILVKALGHGSPSYRKAALYVAVPFRIMGGEMGARVSGALGEEGRRWVSEAVKTVESPSSAQGSFQVPFLEERIPPVVRPESFYASSPLLECYWKAVQWLQYAVFRMEGPSDGPGGIALVQLVFGDPELKKAYRAFQSTYSEWLGWKDRYGLESWAHFFERLLGDKWRSMDPRKVWETYRKSGKKGPSRDSLDWAGSFLRSKRDRVLAFFSPGETPVYRFFFRDMEVTGAQRGFLPSSLDLLASGPLASPCGKRLFRETFGKAPWVEKVLALQAPERGSGIYAGEIEALRLLQGPPHTGATPLFRKPGWKAKMAWTQLGGLVGIEHTLALYRRVLGIPAGGLNPSHGMVSPYPEFFRRLAGIARRSKEILERNRAALPLDFQRIASLALELVRKRIGEYKDVRPCFSPTPKAGDREKGGERMPVFFPRIRWMEGGITGKEELKTALAVKARLEGIKKERIIPERDRVWLEETFLAGVGNAVLSALGRCASILEELGRISKASWGGKEMSEKDARFLLRFGNEVYGVLFKASMEEGGIPEAGEPPLVVNLAWSYVPGSGKILRRLFAGIGRPEAIYLILDVGGRPCLYRGGVLSFREFVLPSSLEMSDSVWKRWVKEGKAPDPPSFTRTFRVPPR